MESDLSSSSFSIDNILKPDKCDSTQEPRSAEGMIAQVLFVLEAQTINLTFGCTRECPTSATIGLG